MTGWGIDSHCGGDVGGSGGGTDDSALGQIGSLVVGSAVQFRRSRNGTSARVINTVMRMWAVRGDIRARLGSLWRGIFAGALRRVTAGARFKKPWMPASGHDGFRENLPAEGGQAGEGGGDVGVDFEEGAGFRAGEADCNCLFDHSDEGLGPAQDVAQDDRFIVAV
jgi:hypothetical protein